MNGLNELETKFGVEQKSEPQKSGKGEGPVSYGWVPLGQGRGIKWVLWKTNVTFHRQEKQGDNWLTTEELHIAPQVLKEIAWRIPGWLECIEKNDGRWKK